MMMQWFVNEVRDKLEQIDQRIEGWARKQVEDAEAIAKLKGELMAMKARLGKNKNNKEPID